MDPTIKSIIARNGHHLLFSWATLLDALKAAGFTDNKAAGFTDNKATDDEVIRLIHESEITAHLSGPEMLACNC